MKLRKILNKHTNTHRYFSFDSLLSNLGLYNHKLKQTDRQEQLPSSPRVQVLLTNMDNHVMKLGPDRTQLINI